MLVKIVITHHRILIICIYFVTINYVSILLIRTLHIGTYLAQLFLYESINIYYLWTLIIKHVTSKQEKG